MAKKRGRRKGSKSSRKRSKKHQSGKIGGKKVDCTRGKHNVWYCTPKKKC